jgi:hypothetical protein
MGNWYRNSSPREVAFHSCVSTGVRQWFRGYHTRTEVIRVVDHEQSAGDALPPNCKRIEVHLVELRQLFNSFDPSPFRERDLDPNAEEFIVSWAREFPRDAPLALIVRLDRCAGLPQEPAALKEAIHEYFRYRAQVTRQRLRQLFWRGRSSLLIGLVALTACLIAGDLIAKQLGQAQLGEMLKESLLIGGWVAMWRPLEIFLYDWWPIRAEARLFDRLSVMPVHIDYHPAARPEAWRSDWPAMPPSQKPPADDPANDPAAPVPAPPPRP